MAFARSHCSTIRNFSNTNSACFCFSYEKSYDFPYDFRTTFRTLFVRLFVRLSYDFRTTFVRLFVRFPYETAKLHKNQCARRQKFAPKKIERKSAVRKSTCVVIPTKLRSFVRKSYEKSYESRTKVVRKSYEKKKPRPFVQQSCGYLCCTTFARLAY